MFGLFLPKLPALKQVFILCPVKGVYYLSPVTQEFTLRVFVVAPMQISLVVFASYLVTVSAMSVAKVASLASLSWLRLLFSWWASLEISMGAEAPSMVGFLLGMFNVQWS